MQKFISARVDHRERARLECQCRSDGISMSELIRRLVFWWEAERRHGRSTPIENQRETVA